MPSGLIVGAEGSIGRALLARLRADRWEVIGTSRRETALDGLIRFDLEHAPERFLRDARLLELLAKKPVAAYLLAGVTRYDHCEEDASRSRRINVDHMVALAALLLERGVFVVFPSSTAALRPATEYGRQKADAERAIAALAARAPAGAGAAIVRMTKVVHLGERTGGWLRDLSRGCAIEAAPDLELAPVSLGYVAEAMRRIGERRESGEYSVSGAHEMSYYAFACRLAVAVGRDSSLVRGAAARGGASGPSGPLAPTPLSRKEGIELQPLESAVADLIREFEGGA